MLQAMLCYLPCVVWRFLSWKTGVDLRLIVQLALSLENVNAETRQRNCNAIARYLHHTFETHYCKRQQALHGNGCSRLMRQLRLDLAFSKHGYGMHLTCSYLLAKLLYCVNIPVQLFIVCRFIGSSTFTYGLDYLHDMLWNNTDVSRSRHFPLVTLCDIVTRSFANNQRFTLECVLPINLVNDKLFFFVWWWLLLLGDSSFLPIHCLLCFLCLLSFHYLRFSASFAANKQCSRVIPARAIQQVVTKGMTISIIHDLQPAKLAVLLINTLIFCQTRKINNNCSTT